MTHEEQIAKLTEMLEIQQKLHETAIDMLKPAIEIAVQKERAQWRILHTDDDDIQEYKRPWVGLTDEERKEVWWSCEQQTPTTFAKAIEAKLKEKNA